MAFAPGRPATLYLGRVDRVRAEGLSARRGTFDPIGARPQPISGPVTPPGVDWAVLMATERTIAALVAFGRSNTPLPNG